MLRRTAKIKTDTIKLNPHLHDHLGNTRITFSADAPENVVIHYAADYFPYGKILRSYAPCTFSSPRYQTTHHERDQATGYDNRGARLYDAEIVRFLGVDPLAGYYPSQSPYNYVAGNPLLFLDPSGATIEIAISGYLTDADGNRVKDENGEYIRASGSIVYERGMNLTGNTNVDKTIQALDGLYSRGLDPNGVIDYLMESSVTTTIFPFLNWNEQNAHDADILWGPKGGLIHEDGRRHSPAVSLMHELGHAYWKQKDPQGRIAEEFALWNPYDPEKIKQYERTQATATGGYDGYKDYEEMWVIKEVEHFAAAKLGQGQRTSHGKMGKFKAVDLFSTAGSKTQIYPEARRH